MTDKIALVTGASRGIGKAIALQLAEDGFTVIGTATTKANAEKITEYLDSGSLGRGFELNLSEENAVENFLEAIKKDYPGIDVLVNNAAITKDNLLMRMKQSDWDDVINVNLTAVFSLTKGLIKPMIKKRWGRIINISSVVGAAGNPGQVNYCASKAGIIGFTKSLALELANRNITANAVAPGFIATDMTDVLSTEQQDAILATVPMQRLGGSKEIAHAVSFLASGRADYITGQTLHVNGGMYLA